MFNRPSTTLPDGYYSLALVTLKTAMDICRQAGIALPEKNEIREADGVEFEGIFFGLGPGRNFSCRAARYNDAEHKTDAGIVISENSGKIVGLASISVLNEPAHRKWLLYAQIMPGCRSPELLDLCERLSIDPLVETMKEIGEAEAFSTVLTTAQWAARIIAAERLKAQ